MTRSPSVRVELDVPARMRDGVTLRANVYRPAGEGPWPTLLTRLPYGKDEPLEMLWLDPVKAARAGFVVVVQDTRGRLASEGEWTPFRHERADGYDSVEWAARLAGSSGRVGMYGLSYYGSTQWLAAIEQPPSLGALAPGLTWCEPLDGLLSRGGALELGLAIPWTLATGAGHLSRLGLSAEEVARRTVEILDDFDDLPRAGYWGLPAHDPPVLHRHPVPDLGTFRMSADAAVPAESRVAGAHQRVTVPTLNIGAWYDVFLQGTLDNFTAMAALGRPARLVVGPWVHDLAGLYDPIGQRYFGVRSGAFGAPVDAAGDLWDVQLAWFRRHLSPDAQQCEPSEAPVRIFVMGRNEWRDEASWPLARARAETWFAHGDGSLSRGAPAADAEPSEYVYDPADPVPTLGGQTAEIRGFPPGPFDQRPVESRDDVLVFTSAPLERELEVTGRVRVVLHAASSAPSTDWVARLCDVDPDGRSFNLCDGILRVAEGADACRRLEVDLWSTSNVFLPGHRLRLHVTSSCFPRWDRNLNTGDQTAGTLTGARQRIHHDAERPSFIELPVVP